MADNGLMYHYEGTSGMSQLIYRGGKTDFLEGGIRVPAILCYPAELPSGVVREQIAAVAVMILPDADDQWPNRHLWLRTSQRTIVLPMTKQILPFDNPLII